MIMLTLPFLEKKQQAKTIENKQILYTFRNTNYTKVKTITIHVKGEPIKAGTDPYNKLIDRNPEDNTGDVEL